MSALEAQLGCANEVTPGTAVTPTRFFEFVSESIQADYGRIESNGLRPGRQFRSDTRFTTYVAGAGGDIVQEIGSKGFGFWLKHMLGAAAAPVGPTVDGAYTHVFTPANLAGLAFTAQVGRPFYDGVTVQPFTYPGGKVASWSISCENDGIATATLTCDFSTETTGTALATASYPTGLESMSWAGATVTVAGTQVDAVSIEVTGDNALDVDRRRLRNNTAKKESLTNDYRAGGFTLVADFESLTQHARVASATAAGAIAETIVTFRGKTVIGGTTYPSLTLTLNGRFDNFEANVDGPASLQQTLTGVYLGADAIEATYVSADSTP